MMYLIIWYEEKLTIEFTYNWGQRYRFRFTDISKILFNRGVLTCSKTNTNKKRRSEIFGFTLGYWQRQVNSEFERLTFVPSCCYNSLPSILA